MAIFLSDVAVSSGSFKALSLDEFCRIVFGRSRLFRRYGTGMQLPVVFSELNGGTWRSIRLDSLYGEVSNRSDAYFSSCTYFPRRGFSRGGSSLYRSGFGSDLADELCAYVLDIDRVDPDSFTDAIESWKLGELPPTLVVCSGHGLHLYYVLENPVEMRKRWRMELAHIGKWLYDVYSSKSLGEIDRHGITQPYRVPGSLSKHDAGSQAVQSYLTGATYDISDLASMAGLEQTHFDIDSFDMSISMARMLESTRSDDGALSERSKSGFRKQNWGFYEWLFSREMDRSRLFGEYGHRYNQVLCLAIAARKNKVPFQRLEDDVRKLYESWNDCSSRYGHPRISWGECLKAMKVYSQNGPIEKFPKWWMEEKVGFEFGCQKRNGRNQHEHLSIVHRRRKLDSMSRLADYLTENPESSKNAAAKQLGMSKTTVSRHWRTACAAAGIEDKRTRMD